MARIGTSRDKPKAPKVQRQLAPVSEPVWLAMGLGGLVVALAVPDAASWLVQPAAVVVSGVGLYGLGRAHGAARPDPAARGRVSQLERAFTQLALMVGYDGPARRPTTEGSGASSPEPEPDERTERPSDGLAAGGRPGTTAGAVGLPEEGG